jgi:hypothetical protein
MIETSTILLIMSARNLYLSGPLLSYIEEEARKRDRSVSYVTRELLTEAIKKRDKAIERRMELERQ